MTLIVVKRGEEEFAEWRKTMGERAAARLEELGMDPMRALDTELGWLIAFPKFEGEALTLDHYQARFLTVKDDRRSVLKGRQVGFSWEIGAEATARCHLKEKHVAVCVSYNLDDAKQKIALVKELWDDLPLEFQKRMTIDTKTEVGFASNTRKRRISKVISYPSKAPRGKSGDVYLDELAHCQNDRQIYGGATALIVRSGGQLTIGSTPMGQRGIFYEIHTETNEEFANYWRQEVPWWLCKNHCRDVRRAAAEAPSMATQDRVAEFGTPRLIVQYEALPIDDFQQEYELMFQDERVSFFPYDLILPCTNKEKHEIPVYQNLDMLCMAAQKLAPLEAGFDVGRVHHASELMIFEHTQSEAIQRYEESYKDMPFPKQRARLFAIIDRLGDRLRRFRIDSTGLGKDLAESLAERYGKRKIIEYDFTMHSKERLCNNFKIMLQEQSIVMHKGKKLRGQIHSIKQKITSAGNTIFDAEKSRHHHGDKFWAAALAVLRKRERRGPAPEVSVRVLGEKAGDRAPDRSELTEIAGPDATALLEGEHARRAALRAVPDGDLRESMAACLVAARVWKRSGDQDSSTRYRTEYQRLRRELARRKRAAAK